MPRREKYVTFRLLPFAALLAPLLLAMTTTADASTVCERLNARLSNLPRIVTSNVNLREYTGAISRQNLDLRRARSDRRRMGCSSGSVLVVGGPNQDACDGLNAVIARMEIDLETLKARRQSVVLGGDGEIIRRRIVAALEINRCAEEQDALLRAAAQEPETHRNILSDLPPIGEGDPEFRDSDDFPDFAMPGIGYGGSLRTMCVRTCDGAFFPISSNATPADFQRDAQTCEQRCPGAQTALYFHALETEETDQMISAASGEPYLDLPTAFAYKTRDLSQPGQCGCSPVGRSASNQTTPDEGSGILEIITAKPEKTAPAADAVIAERPYDPKSSKIRLVGPSFLPSQESAIDLRHPTGPGYQQQQQTN